jgi:hypothetical protein
MSLPAAPRKAWRRGELKHSTSILRRKTRKSERRSLQQRLGGVLNHDARALQYAALSQAGLTGKRRCPKRQSVESLQLSTYVGGDFTPLSAAFHHQ